MENSAQWGAPRGESLPFAYFPTVKKCNHFLLAITTEINRLMQETIRKEIYYEQWQLDRTTLQNDSIPSNRQLG